MKTDLMPAMFVLAALCMAAAVCWEGFGHYRPVVVPPPSIEIQQGQVVQANSGPLVLAEEPFDDVLNLVRNMNGENR